MPHRVTESKFSPRRVKAKMNAVSAIDLRLEGMNYRDIAARLGYKSPQAAFDAIQREFDAYLQEPIETLRKQELARLDNLYNIAINKAKQGDMIGVNTCIRVLERRAKLLGLDQLDPVQQELLKDYVIKINTNENTNEHKLLPDAQTANISSEPEKD